MYTQQLAEVSNSPVRPLISKEDIAKAVERLRAHLAQDDSPEAVDSLKSAAANRAREFNWWQRVPIPGLPIYSSTDRGNYPVADPGWLNTLGGVLTTNEGCLLRPMPKWAYIEPLLPPIAGKSVLEIGCNNGFFSLEFAKLGACKVTGYEVFDGFARAAKWVVEGQENIEIVAGDALLDLTIEPHDMVFMSEVHGHFIDPLFGISRAVSLAKEWLIIDGAAHVRDEVTLEIGGDIDPASGKMDYHAWIMSDGLMLNYLQLCGIPPEKVVRYTAPWAAHVMYIADVRDKDAYRKATETQPCNISFANMNFRR